MTREECGDVSNSYTEQRVCRYTIAPVVQANQFNGWAQSGKSCEVILSTDDED